MLTLSEPKKFYTFQDKDRDNHSIVKKGNIYNVTGNGEQIGSLRLTEDEYFNVKGGNYKDILTSLNIDAEMHYIEVMESHGYTMSSTKFEAAVYKKVNKNDLGFGVFELRYSPEFGNYFKDYEMPKEISTIISNHNLKEDILNFFSQEKTNTRKNKKGILLYGPPGNGKTTEIMSLFSVAEELKMRILLISRQVDFSALNSFKHLLRDGKTVFVLEELTQRTDADGTEELLTFLDGENSWENSVVIATTNYPEELPSNLVDRPGRFETFIEYANPEKADILALAEKFGLDDVSSLFNKDLSFDYVSFIMSQAKKHSITVNEAMQEEKKKKEKISNTFKSQTKMGI